MDLIIYRNSRLVTLPTESMSYCLNMSTILNLEILRNLLILSINVILEWFLFSTGPSGTYLLTSTYVLDLSPNIYKNY